MDRLIVYPGATPLDTDLLNVQRYAHVALGYLAQAALGTGVVADGLVASAGAGLGVVIGPGSLMAPGVIDSSAFGSLGADASPLMRMAINPVASSVLIGVPASAGTSQVFLIEACFSEADTNPVVLPYFNAAAATIAWNGPSGSGGAQPTQRMQRVALQAIAGAPAPSGSAVAPAPSAGWTPLYTVVMDAGMVSVPASRISVATGAPFLSFKLPQLRPGMSQLSVFTSSGTFVVPNGVTQIRVRAVGGGGGGAGASSTLAGSGGGGGGYAEAILSVAPGTSIWVTVGAGGAGGANASTWGTNGGTSSFGPYIAATGGQGGLVFPGGASGGFGGTGYGPQICCPGGAGMDGLAGSWLGAASGGASYFGGGGRGARGPWSAGGPSDAQAFGAGGGGAYLYAAQGGSGANGVVIVEW